MLKGFLIYEGIGIAVLLVESIILNIVGWHNGYDMMRIFGVEATKRNMSGIRNKVSFISGMVVWPDRVLLALFDYAFLFKRNENIETSEEES